MLEQELKTNFLKDEQIEVIKEQYNLIYEKYREIDNYGARFKQSLNDNIYDIDKLVEIYQKANKDVPQIVSEFCEMYGCMAEQIANTLGEYQFIHNKLSKSAPQGEMIYYINNNINELKNLKGKLSHINREVKRTAKMVDDMAENIIDYADGYGDDF